MFPVTLIQQYKISEFFDAGKINNYGTKVKKNEVHSTIKPHNDKPRRGLME